MDSEGPLRSGSEEDVCHMCALLGSLLRHLSENSLETGVGLLAGRRKVGEFEYVR